MSDEVPKKYRVYFNRLNEAPQVWSIDEGTQDTEINVTAVEIVDCYVMTKVDLDESVNHDRPKAWLEVHGHLRVDAGKAIITSREDKPWT